MALKGSNPRRQYRYLLQQSPKEFLETLRNNILMGPQCKDHVFLQIQLLEENDMTNALANFRGNTDENLLQVNIPHVTC